MKSFAQSLTAGTLILTIVLAMALVPIQRARAQWTVYSVGDVVFFTKEYVLDTLAVIVAKAVIQKITTSTVNWILSGYEGNPSFIDDPRSVFAGLGDTVADDFLTRLVTSDNENVAGIGKALCSPFSLKVRAAIAFNYYAGTNPTESTKCTLDQVVKNSEAFLSGDFLEGGWDGFYVTAVKGDNPNDQFYKFSLALQSEVAGEKEELKQELTQGSGFFSIRDCRGKSVNKYDKGQRELTADEAARASAGDENCKITTPGSYIAESLPQLTTSAVRQAELADELNEAVASIAVALIQQTLGGVGGLSGAAKSPTGGKSIIQQYAEDDSSEAALVNLQNNTVKMYTDYRSAERKHLNAVEDMLSAARSAENALKRAIKCPTGLIPFDDPEKVLTEEVEPLIAELPPKAEAIRARITKLDGLIVEAAQARNSKQAAAVVYEEDGVTLRYQPSDQEEAVADQNRRDDVVKTMNSLYERANAAAGSCSV